MLDSTENENSIYGSKTPLRIGKRFSVINDNDLELIGFCEGDYVVLKLSKPEEGWLSSPGLLDDNCFATTDPDHFENCIWEIHVQNQYSAAKEFKEALIESIKNAVVQVVIINNTKSLTYS